MTFNMFIKILATVGLFFQGWYYAHTMPGLMDVINGSVVALVLCSLWLLPERIK